MKKTPFKWKEVDNYRVGNTTELKRTVKLLTQKSEM